MKLNFAKYPYLTRSFKFLSNILSRLPFTFCRAMIAGPALQLTKYLPVYFGPIMCQAYSGHMVTPPISNKY